MEKAVDVAEKNMSRFGLSQAEISKRRKWVMQTRTKVQTSHGRVSRQTCTGNGPQHPLACDVFTIVRLQKLQCSA